MNISFTPYTLLTKKVNQTTYVFDVVRRKNVILTPEEFIRQQILQLITQKFKYPLQAIAVEKQIKVGERRKRFDIVIFKNAKPWMIIECKSNYALLNESVMQQIIEYNLVLKASYLLLTNGRSFVGYCVQNGNLVKLENLPNW